MNLHSYRLSRYHGES